MKDRYLITGGAELIDDATKMSVLRGGWMRPLFTTMRPHQWTKNLFVLTPLLFSGKLADSTAVWNAAIAFASFCLLSSAVYIFNDWWDAEEDRAHPEKRLRPISSGALPASIALTAAALNTTLGLVLGLLAGPKFAAIGLLYAVLMAAYCVGTKRMIVLDAMTISAGFVLRVVGGAAAIGVAASHWLIACTFLLALFLAFAKRRQELLSLENVAADHREVLNIYSPRYLESVINIVIGATIVCYALYTVAPETVEKFGTDNLVYGSVFVIYGMLRYLSLINDPSKGGNPSKLLLSDPPLLITLAGWVIYNAAVIYKNPAIELLLTIVH